MKDRSWQLTLAGGLLALSAALYFVHYLLFRDAHHIFLYLVGDVAFLPVEVLLVTLVIHRLLTAREKRQLLEKMNMVIGAFFSEVGTELLRLGAASDANFAAVRGNLVVSGRWTRRDFAEVGRRLAGFDYQVDASPADLAALRAFLSARRDFLLRLLENPNLLEHESFTALLWAVFHLAEELARRGDLAALPPADRAHLSGDLKRAYVLCIAAWLQYMEHLKAAYPYLFSLALRTNPFDPAAEVEVKAA